MASSGIRVFACLVLACVMLAAPYAEAITCGQVVSSLSPCIPYLRSGGRLPPNCCAGVKSLNSAARTTPDRQAACRCLISAARGIPGIKPPLANGLPGRCGVNIPYKISPSTDCSKVR